MLSLFGRGSVRRALLHSRPSLVSPLSSFHSPQTRINQIPFSTSTSLQSQNKKDKKNDDEIGMLSEEDGVNFESFIPFNVPDETGVMQGLGAPLLNTRGEYREVR